jgi:hypothetical protein
LRFARVGASANRAPRLGPRAMPNHFCEIGRDRARIKLSPGREYKNPFLMACRLEDFYAIE